MLQRQLSLGQMGQQELARCLCSDDQELRGEGEEKVEGGNASETGKADEPSKPPGKPRRAMNSSRGAAAEEEEGQEEESPHHDAARGDAEGKELSFGANDDCGICLDKLRIPVKLPCGHWYCKECIEGVRQRKSLPDSCPVCREPLPPGAEKLFDEACQKYMKVERAVEREGWGWGRLPRKVQEEMDAVHELWVMAATQGHVRAQFNSGNLYWQGQGVAQDFTAAREWFEKAAAQGHETAQYSLGILYHNGEGVPQDFTAAREWFEKAVAQGHADSQNSLGFMHANGDGVPEDFTTARKWYEKAAAQGHACLLYTSPSPRD